MHSKLKIIFKRRYMLMFFLLAFVFGLALALMIFNRQQRRIDNHFEVTFIDPRQAIVFWTTETDSLGFVKYGKSSIELNQTAQQTSSVAGKIHAVLLTDIPGEGLYLSLHTDKDSPFLWPEIKKINFDPSKIY